MKISNVTVDALPSELKEMLSETLFIWAQFIEYETIDSNVYVVSFVDLKEEEMVELVFENGKVTHKDSISLESIEKAMKLYPEVFGFGKEMKQ